MNERLNERWYEVWCREDTKSDGSKGDYVKATRRNFKLLDEARRYAGTINHSRDPEIFEVSRHSIDGS